MGGADVNRILVAGTPFELRRIDGEGLVPSCLVYDRRTARLVKKDDGKNLVFHGTDIADAEGAARVWCSACRNREPQR